MNGYDLAMPRRQLAALIAEHHLPYPVLIDRNHYLAKYFDAQITPPNICAGSSWKDCVLRHAGRFSPVSFPDRPTQTWQKRTGDGKLPCDSARAGIAWKACYRNATQGG
jgi:hypothetical protein